MYGMYPKSFLLTIDSSRLGHCIPSEFTFGVLWKKSFLDFSTISSSFINILLKLVVNYLLVVVRFILDRLSTNKSDTLLVLKNCSTIVWRLFNKLLDNFKFKKFTAIIYLDDCVEYDFPPSSISIGSSASIEVDILQY